MKKYLLLVVILLISAGCAHKSKTNLQRNVATSFSLNSGEEEGVELHVGENEGMAPSIAKYELVDFNKPSLPVLISNSKIYFRTHSLGFDHSINLSSAEPIEFYTIDKFSEANSIPNSELGPKILGIFNMKSKTGKDLKFGLVYSDNGEPLRMYGVAQNDPEEVDKCIPYFLYTPGVYTIYYDSQDKNGDLWALRDKVMKSFAKLIKENKLTSFQEGASISLEPNSDRYESQQSIYISNGKVLQENEIKEAVKTIKVSGAKNIFLSLALAAGTGSFFGPTKCTLIKN